MVEFRPHTLKLSVSLHGSYDSLGRFITGEEIITKDIPCRFEPNGRANTIALEDGTIYTYSYMVYLDVDCPEISFGDVIELFDQYGQSKGCFTAHGFHRGQLNSKLWL